MIDIILLEPVVPGNIGAVARAMKNFGFSRLVLINPHCNHLCDEARNRAKHAQDVLENAEVIDFFIVDDYDYLIATTALVGTDYNIPRSPLSPSGLANKIKKINAKSKIGLVIGREGNGMFNEEIKKCDFVVTIPASIEYPTLNISHSVSIMLYELHKTFSETTSTSHINPIGKTEKEQITLMFEEIFNSMKWETKEKKETQQKLWKKIVGKAMLTKREAYGIMGFLRKIMWIKGKAKAVKAKPKTKPILRNSPRKEVKSKKALLKKTKSKRGTAKAEEKGKKSKVGSAGKSKPRKRKATKSGTIKSSKPGKRKAIRRKSN